MGKTADRRSTIRNTSDEEQDKLQAEDAWGLAALLFMFLGLLLPLFCAMFKVPIWTSLSEGARVAWAVPNIFLFGFCFLRSLERP